MTKLIEWIRKLIKAYRKPEPLPIPLPDIKPDKPVDGCGCDLTKPICDPPYDKAWLDGRARAEEVGIEAEMKIISRFCVKHPSDGKIWMLATVGKLFVKRGANNFGEYKCTSINGYRYHVLGYQAIDPQGRDGIDPQPAINKYVICEARKV